MNIPLITGLVRRQKAKRQANAAILSAVHAALVKRQLLGTDALTSDEIEVLLGAVGVATKCDFGSAPPELAALAAELCAALNLREGNAR